jgi:hypothetical protein
MGKRYDLLAKHFVNLGNRFSSDEEIIAFLKSRTVRISFTSSVQPGMVTLVERM